MIRVVIVDDEELVRGGVQLVVESDPEIQVVGEASNGRDGVAVVADLQPDVVLMDIRMPVLDGIAAVEKIDPAVPVIMLTAFDTDEFIAAALRAGAVGFLLKNTPPKALTAAVRAAHEGQQILSPGVVGSLLDAEPKATPKQAAARAKLAHLSGRELEIARLVAEGLSNAEIAAAEFVSITTVKTHVQHILRKLPARSRIHIVITVLDAGL